MIRFDNHAFKGLDEAFRQLFAQLTAMSDGAAQLMDLLPQAINRADEALFVRAKEIDKTINDAELAVDSAVAAIINKFTVMSEELRFTLGAVKISGALERAADKLKNCVKRLIRVQNPIEAVVQHELLNAVAALHTMLPLAMAQVLDYSPEVTERLLAAGAVVQKSYRAILIHLHAHNANPGDETHLLLVAKNLEQAADVVVEVLKVSYYIHHATKFDKRAVVAST